MSLLKYRVTVEFIADANFPKVVEENLEALKTVGDIIKVQASATKAHKAE